MSLAITQASEFNASDVGFSKLRKNKNGGKAVYLNKGGNNKLFIQFPKLRCPYGCLRSLTKVRVVRRTAWISRSTPTIRKRWNFARSLKNSTNSS
jgi:hypothetical protein